MLGPTFISRYRDATTALLAACDTLQALQRPYVALDLGNTLTQDDFDAGNADVTLAQLIAAVGSVSAIEGLLAQGHLTNLYTLSR